MAIRHWHVGKLVLLWAWGVVLSVVVIQIIAVTDHFVPGFALIALLVSILVALSATTWKWLSARENKQ
jgi:hypothetical protein